jgi:hypothetical protein
MAAMFQNFFQRVSNCMIKHLFLPLMAIWWLCQSANATPTLVQGNAFYYKGKQIELHQYSDLFTFSSTIRATQAIPSDGNFRFEINVETTGLYLIKIDRVHAHVFLEPGNEYTLVLPEPEEVDRFNPAKDVFILPEIFESKGKLNHAITSIEKTINAFLLDHQAYYGRGVNRKIIPLADSLSKQLSQSYSSLESSFFQTHFKYRLATFELQTNHSRKDVFDRYFKDQQPAYMHLSYANAFSLFFEEYFNYLNPVRAHRFQAEVDTAIHSSDYDRLISSMAVDPFLNDIRLRELLAVYQLYELGAERKYPLANIMGLLDVIALSAQDAECRTIAENAQVILNRLAPGTMAPDFEFTDLVGNIYRLSEYKGRHIYVQFFDDFNAETLKEMSLMKVLKEGYGSDIAMFSISTGENLQRLKRISDEYDFNWFFGKALTPSATMEDYDLRALPAYFYMDDELIFIKSPAPPPGAKIEKLFAKAWNQAHPNKSLHFKLQPPEVDEETLTSPQN